VDVPFRSHQDAVTGQGPEHAGFAVVRAEHAAHLEKHRLCAPKAAAAQNNRALIRVLIHVLFSHVKPLKANGLSSAGDFALFLLPATLKGKLDNLFSDDLNQVVRVLENNTYELRSIITGYVRVAHARQMRPFHMDLSRYSIEEARRRMFDKAGGETLIDSIMSHRRGPDGKLEFLVDWFHWDDYCPTHQPATALRGADIFRKYCARHGLDTDSC
jgi:hypothetical protein